MSGIWRRMHCRYLRKHRWIELRIDGETVVVARKSSGRPIWLVRELLRLIVTVALGSSIALALAALWAVVSVNAFRRDLFATTFFIGAVLLLMGVSGIGSNFERAVDADVTQTAWGRVPGVPWLSRRGEDPRINPGIVLVFTALALFAFALFVVHQPQSG